MRHGLFLVCCFVVVLVGANVGATILFTEDFEGAAATDDATATSYTQGVLPVGWVGSSQGYGAGKKGVNNIGDTNIVLSTRYTNSGATSGVGKIGRLKGNTVYKVTFDVARDRDDPAHIPYAFGVLVYADGANRADVTGMSNGSVALLGQNSGNAPADGSTATKTINYACTYGVAAARVGYDLAVRIDGASTTANIDNIQVETLVEDTTPPTLLQADITDDSGGSVTAWSNITYTLTFDDWIPAPLLDGRSFTNVAGTTPAPYDFISAAYVSSNVIDVVLMPTDVGNVLLQVTTNLTDAALNNLGAAVTDADTIVVDPELIAPVVTSIVDNASGGPIMTVHSVIYTVYFDEPVDSAQVTTSIFENGGTAGGTIDSVTALPAGAYGSYAPSYQIQVTPAQPGSLMLQIMAGATIQDRAGNNLVTSSAIPDDTAIIVNPVPNIWPQLGILNSSVFLENFGQNPATGDTWKRGDTYRLVFVTTATTDATSTNITDYNTFVQSVAAGSSAFTNLGDVAWYAIASTASIDARDNTATSPGVSPGDGPAYLLNGTTRFAANYADIWDGLAANRLSITEENLARAKDTGTSWNNWVDVWTGTTGNGTKNNPLGSSSAQFGLIYDAPHMWISRNAAANTTSLPMYAISEPLTIDGPVSGSILIVR